MQTTTERKTEIKIAEVFQDLEHPDAHIYVVCKDRIYQFYPEPFRGFLNVYSRKSIATDEIGVPLQFAGEEQDEDWKRFQNRGDL